MSNSQELCEGSRIVLDFLKKNVPKANLSNAEAELKTDFILAKRRSKEQKRKTNKNKTRALTRKEKKDLGFYEIPRNSLKYSDMIPLNEIWSGYMSELLEFGKGIPDYSSKAWFMFTQSMYKADFQGSMLTIVRSKCPSYVGKTGICIMDTKYTFKVISENDVITTIPKKECVFEVLFPCKRIKLTIFGKLLCARPAERSTKKVKCQGFPDL